MRPPGTPRVLRLAGGFTRRNILTSSELQSRRRTTSTGRSPRWISTEVGAARTEAEDFPGEIMMATTEVVEEEEGAAGEFGTRRTNGRMAGLFPMETFRHSWPTVDLQCKPFQDSQISTPRARRSSGRRSSQCSFRKERRAREVEH